MLIKNSCHELKTEHIWKELIRNISNLIYRHSRFYILSHHHHPISPFPFFHITPSPLRWQAGEFHFGSACLSIYLKLSNSNYIYQTIAENKDTYIHTYHLLLYTPIYTYLEVYITNTSLATMSNLFVKIFKCRLQWHLDFLVDISASQMCVKKCGIEPTLGGWAWSMVRDVWKRL